MLGLPNAARAQATLDKGLAEDQQRKDAKGVMSNFNDNLAETLMYAPSQMLSRWQLPTMDQKISTGLFLA